MDSLTKRLMATSGLRPGNPTLPPIQGVRMVYLDEPMTGAENALHEARLALEAYKTLEKKDPKDTDAIKKAQDGLYEAMGNLEAKEQDYFARRYFGRNKAVLNGWKSLP